MQFGHFALALFSTYGTSKMFSEGRCQWVLFLVLSLLDFADFASDWLFYADLTNEAEGLVYGPVEPGLVYGILALSILGTVLFIAEILNLYREMFTGSEWFDSDYLAFVSVWCEDVPQIIISLIIALCREDAVSYFQLIKAGTALVLICVRVIISFVKYCNRDFGHTHHHKMKAAIVIGVIIEAICASSIFYFTNTNPGSTEFRVPQTLVRDEFRDERYFAGVAVFVHHRGVFDQGQLDVNPNNSPSVNWMRAASLDDVRDKGVVHVRYDYKQDKDDGYSLHLAIWQKNATIKKWSLTGCYTVIHRNATVYERNNQMCNSIGFLDNDATSVFLAIKFTRPETSFFKKRIFGHMVFNAKIRRKGKNSCQDLHDAVKTDSQKSELTLHFFRTGSDLSYDEAKHMNHKTKSLPSFYKNGTETLVDVRDAWKTGWSKCEMTGYVSPPLDTKLDVPCTISEQ